MSAQGMPGHGNLFILFQQPQSLPITIGIKPVFNHASLHRSNTKRRRTKRPRPQSQLKYIHVCLVRPQDLNIIEEADCLMQREPNRANLSDIGTIGLARSEEHTSELQSQFP